MGTNYYARVIPTKERKKEIITAVLNDDFTLINKLVNETYGLPAAEDGELLGGNIHLGKASCGWKFLWNPNIYKLANGHLEEGNVWVVDDPTILQFYELNKKSITDFVNQDNVLIYDEYGELQDKKEFLEYAFNKDGWDSEAYHKWEHEQYPERKNFWNYKTYYVEFLISLGYKMNEGYNDFYSDGLRFATYTEFS